MEQAKYDVFISYSRKDYVDEQKNVISGNVVSKIKDALTEAGITYWLDKEGIIPGQKFSEVITKSIEASKVFLFLASKNSNPSEWIHKEINFADKYNKLIIPFRIDESHYDKAIELALVNRDEIEYYANPENGLAEMVDSIKKYIKQEQEEEQLIKEIRQTNEVLNNEETKLMEERDKLLKKTEEVSDTQERANLKKEIQESSPIGKKYQEERLSQLKKIEDLEQENERIEQLEKELEKTRSELEPYQTAAKRQAEARGEFTANDVFFKMIRVEGGTFTMGIPYKQGNRVQLKEFFPHQISLSAYWIGETEVTQELWEAVMGSNPSYHKGANLPVEKVSWEDCNRFIDKLNSITASHNS